MATPHNTASIKDIAKNVLMPGDPLRAQYIAENYLENAVCFNEVRNMLGFTGLYRGKEVSVMGAGMGIPSIGIYSYELFNFYDVDSIIRVGSAGAISKDIHLKDIVIAMGACTNSNYAHQYMLPGTFAPTGDFDLARKAVEIAEKNGISVHVGNVLSSDVFYNDYDEAIDKWRKMGVLAEEMEAAGLYMNAARASKRALCILSISDIIGTDEELSPQERQTGFDDMIKIALELAFSMAK